MNLDIRTKNKDNEFMLANAAARRGYSITPTSPSSRLMFI